MSASTKPTRLVLLAERADWIERLRACLADRAVGFLPLIAPSWSAVPSDVRAASQGLLITTPGCRPPAEACAWPVILLLEEEPASAPTDAIDWLLGDQLQPETLRRTLRYARERLRLQGLLQRLSAQDPLTGIANRQGFQAQLENRLAEYGSQGVALGLLDLDHFRRVNEALGHQAGDRLILQVVARLKAQLEAGDSLARTAGDEFALLLDVRRDPGRLERIADRVVEALGEPYWLDGETLMLGCSLGIARAGVDAEPDHLMWHAQIAMRQAKAGQGCTWHLYQERLHRSARSLADLEGELRRALRRDELELHYQPRMSLEDGRIVGMEALVRWRRGKRGLMAPTEFIPMAEESGLIVPLGYWVIDRALRDMQRLNARGLGGMHLAINLSFRQFQDSQLLPTLQRLIAERGIDPSWLEFELTETAVMRRSDPVRETMQALETLGVRFSLDDFGTGFSSFVHLKSLPVALLKIDRSFILAIEERPEGHRLVQAMIALGRNLRLEVVAEGVETPRQLALLRNLGADQVQGYLVSKPLPINELFDFFAEGRRAPVGA
ncbi:putative bifunctional diguanylate cyclase/phosphodiesterase [Stutzerimonas azotifigens]|uniref:putative bifunctional diguanylate cyclase/phosphodiesterase n=1 Tax=Stutzerimonas azotifigens TaxID=291995 RepID=UPI00047F8D4C|nr:bifunctional diguanylate cyclase/phosphodiesterase [Stutzerimonas azotifigens]